ncbi:hypothetical protein IMAU60210_01662 [Lactobacillus helveticus]|uniref:hypothetical protein n=1 Tax=Lactobacillus helveticus TaxID=1587 RepID=UPI0015624FAE|nr:hypothetical protein [Lactobacillus helveticus]NRO47474.1 hypothetical protein [Lactobacillus helveticus]
MISLKDAFTKKKHITVRIPEDDYKMLKRIEEITKEENHKISFSTVLTKVLEVGLNSPKINKSQIKFDEKYSKQIAENLQKIRDNTDELVKNSKINSNNLNQSAKYINYSLKTNSSISIDELLQNFTSVKTYEASSYDTLAEVREMVTRLCQQLLQ